MTKRTIEQILDELRRGRRPLLADKPAESDASRYDCLRRKDQEVISSGRMAWKSGRCAVHGRTESEAGAGCK